MIKRIMIILIHIYQMGISPLFPPRCRFYPTCSQYAKEAIISKGVIRAIPLIFWRLLKCHPFHPGGYDPVK